MKKSMLFIAGLFLSAAIAGCGTPSNRQPAPTQQIPAAEEMIPARRETTLTLYLPDEDGMRISRFDFKVPAAQKTLKTALYQMIRLDQEASFPILPAGLSIKNVTVENGTATVNFSKELLNLSGGTTTEALFIAMTVNTATEFPNVKEVRFTVEGKPISHLTGHTDMTQPFRRDESFIRMQKD